MMLEISGSYVLSALIILAVGRIWHSNSEGRKRIFQEIDRLKDERAELDKRVAVLESERAATQATLKEIKEDVKYIRERLPRTP